MNIIKKSQSLFFNKWFFINISVFFYMTVLLVNFFYNTYNSYKETNINLGSYEKNLPENKNNLKKNISDILTANSSYVLGFNRDCKITGDMHDRHKVRWVKNFAMKKIFQEAKNYGENAPYYVNIFLHSLLLFLTFYFVNKTFVFNKSYNYLFLLYITFIFQQYLGEYSYSIFEIFFLSLALYASKNKKIIVFLITCVMAVLNRESGFIIIFMWLLFNNKDLKQFMFIFLVSLILFAAFNFDIIECVTKPQFFIPLQAQEGQINLIDLKTMSIFSAIKVIFVNFLLPFGFIFYFTIKTKQKNNILILIAIIYLLTLLIAAPAHHVAVRLVLLPIIFASIHFSNSLGEETNQES